MTDQAAASKPIPAAVNSDRAAGYDAVSEHSDGRDESTYVTLSLGLVDRLVTVARGAHCTCVQSAGATSGASGEVTAFIGERHYCLRCRALLDTAAAVNRPPTMIEQFEAEHPEVMAAARAEQDRTRPRRTRKPVASEWPGQPGKKAGDEDGLIGPQPIQSPASPPAHNAGGPA